MSLEFWSTLASVATFVVIGVTAVAAFVQLRHIRRANQLAGLQGIFDMIQDPGVRELINYVRHDLGDRMKDKEFRESLTAIPIDRREHPELFLCDMYNHIGSFVRSGLIDERVYLQTDWYNVSLYWDLLRDVVVQARRTRPYNFENFEWLAARAQTWIEAHPQGDYPPGARRMS
ncbi:MAG: hypothetical protein WA814_12410 [Candidatus Baltobacteraceae bacterium]